MKLVRYGAAGLERLGLVDAAGRLRDLSGLIPDISSATIGSSAWSSLANLDPDSLPEIGPEPNERLGPCVGGVGKLICLGLNERAHANQIQAGASTPPLIFLKATSSIAGAQDPVEYPRDGKKLDWEAELAVVIGKRCKYVTKKEARSVVAGYCILTDISDRHWQTDHNGRMTLVTTAKSFDAFAPMGRYLVTPDEVENPDQLPIKLWVNGELRQDFSSADYIYGVDQAIAFTSTFFTLFPGDVISLGSGPGNGFAWKSFLEVGDRVSASVEGLGRQDFSITAEPAREHLGGAYETIGAVA